METGKWNDVVKISIVTACYNSENFLGRIYQSIKTQDYKNIEWVTVDDHSTDDTLKKLYELKSRNEIDVKIKALPKNTRGFGALQTGINMATGKFTLILDHDDELLPGAISRLMHIWDTLAPGEEKLYGIWGRCVDENNVTLGKLYDKAPLICSNGYVLHELKCRRECSLMIDTDLLKRYFILPEHINITTNGYFWNRLGNDYRCIFTNELTRRYHTNIPTQQTQKKKIPNSLSFSYQELEYLNDNHSFFWKDLPFFLRKILIYLNFSHHAGVPLKESVKKFKHSELRIAAILLLPLLPFLLFKNRVINKRVYD